MDKRLRYIPPEVPGAVGQWVWIDERTERMEHVAANIINDAFRGYEDDTSGPIGSQTPIAAVDTNWTQAVDTTFHVAMLATNTNAADSKSEIFTLQYRINGGTWTDVTTTSAVKAVTATNCTTTDAASYGTTALTTGATIQATEYDNDGATEGNLNGITLNSSSAELVTALQLDSASISNGDSVELRLTDDGTALDADTTIPNITATAPVNLTANDTESDSDVTDPSIGQVHALGAAGNAVSESDVTDPTVSEIVDLLAENVESSSDVTDPTAGAISNLGSAGFPESDSDVTDPGIGQVHAIGPAGFPESESDVTDPALAEIHNLLAENVSSDSDVTDPSLAEEVANVSLFAENVESASDVTDPAFAEDVEILRPDADNTVGNWTTDTGSSTNLYQAIDETTPNDTDYIQSELAPSTSVVKIRLSDPTGTLDATKPQIFRYRYAKPLTDSQQIDLTVRIVQGASTEVASWTHTNIGTTAVTQEQTLTTGQKANITDGTDLFLEFEANAP